MKKVITLLLMAVILTACGTTTIVDTRFAKVEDIKFSTSKEYKYTAIAWQYKPKVKKYVIHTDSLYNVGEWIELKKIKLL
jgi:hypothetical protein